MDDDFKPAMAAVYGDDLDRLQELIDADPTLVTRRSSKSHPTLLQFVAVDGGLGKIPRPVEAAAILVAAGATVQQPLVAAAGVNARELVLFLLEHGGSLTDGLWLPLDEAQYWKKSELARELVALGAPVRRLRNAAALGDIDAMSSFFDGDRLIEAAGPIAGPFDDRVNPEFVNDRQQLLDNAFFYAILHEEFGAAQWLIDHGADIDGMPTGFHWEGSALHVAVWWVNPTSLVWLLDRGADTTIRDREFNGTPLGVAEYNKRDELIAILREHG